MSPDNDITVYLRGQECKLSFHRHVPTGRTMVRLRDAAHGDHVGWATTIHPLDMATGEKTLVVIDYPGQSGMLQALEFADVAKRTGQHVTVGGLLLPIAELLVDPHLPPRDRQTPLKDLLTASNEPPQRKVGGVEQER